MIIIRSDGKAFAVTVAGLMDDGPKFTVTTNCLRCCFKHVREFDVSEMTDVNAFIEKLGADDARKALRHQCQEEMN